jgi:hypothetical protein
MYDQSKLSELIRFARVDADSTVIVSVRWNAPDIGGTAVAAAIPCAAFRQPMRPARGSRPQCGPGRRHPNGRPPAVRQAVRATDRQQPRGAPSTRRAAAREA